MDRQKLLNQTVLLSYAVLAGVAPLIPIPMMDDWGLYFIRRKMVEVLAKNYQLTLSNEELDRLTDQEGCCMGDSLRLALMYAIRRIYRKVLFVLELQRGIDVASHSYYYGYLIEYSFREKLYQPGDPRQAMVLHMAINLALQQANTRLGRQAFFRVFKNSQALLVAIATWFGQQLTHSVKRSGRWIGGLLARLFKRRAASKEEIQTILEGDAPLGLREVGLVIERLRNELVQLPEDHFSDLEARLRKNLETYVPPFTHTSSST